MTHDKDAIEAVARAICRAQTLRHYGGIGRDADEAWSGSTEYARSEWLADAEAAIAALRSPVMRGREND